MSDTLGEGEIVKNEVLINVQRLRIEESHVTIIHCEGEKAGIVSSITSRLIIDTFHKRKRRSRQASKFSVEFSTVKWNFPYFSFQLKNGLKMF